MAGFVSHGIWGSFCSALVHWRNGLAERAGYLVLPVATDHGPQWTPMLDWGHLPDGAMMGLWRETPSDPLLVLLVHHDDQGVIRPEQALALATRLEGFRPKPPGHDTTLERWIAGLRRAAEAGEDVVFGSGLPREDEDDG